MEEFDNFKVGDYVFLFFNRTGAIFSARILEKTIKETISNGLKTEFVLEAYQQEGDGIIQKKIKFSDDKCKMFKTIEDLRVELHEHVMAAVNSMISECNSIYNSISQVQSKEV